MNIIRKTNIWCLVIWAGIVVTGCKKPYNPSVTSNPNRYLVVEGVIDISGNVAVIKLSQTVNIGESIKNSTLDNYSVTVQDQADTTFVFQSEGNGKYDSRSSLTLDATKKYRLHIASPEGKVYESDYVDVKKTPPIDSVGFIPKGDNLNIYVNTHDATNNTRYYRWDYEESWKFHSKYESGSIVDPVTKVIRPRTTAEAAYYCFTGDTSSTIVIGSSAKLASDVIFQGPITAMASTSEKISVRYSILVRQYALTKEAYEFWENIKKNTEQLGSIFDAQPSELQGNIHCVTDPKEPVIGFISVTNIQQKRIYINNQQLPAEWYPKYPYDCTADSALFYNPKTMAHEVQLILIDGYGSLPISSIVQMNSVVGYTYSTIECTDCRIRGKSLPPPFWKP